MTQQSRPSSRISPLARGAYFCIALVPIYLAISLNLRHPLQLAMDVLAPLSFLLLAATDSYRSPTAKLALVAALLLWALMIAQPFLHPQPWRF
ncbi:hypothetical protein [Pseudoxanthomonas sp. PXM01]|uniref:hypothetical protein n=1 Tax=Pseudoxanthomonas sp. PXM01 TaxID=2769295 RepID=UPI001781F270|nr:hypothetical protein [Pseudoxanthomonas sp. PXM01]MBD9469480.1 hypothetical protein [Pseudoxanthomonas sp. PXM01]